jgi:Tfp pilus assembly protein PilF
MPGLQKISAGEFTRRLRADSELPDKRFAFFLGAGCSVSSGIPGATSLVKDYWLPRLLQLCAPECSDKEAWIKKEFPHYDPAAPALSYGAVMERLFLTPEDRQQEVERLCEGRLPAFGYAVLAKLVTRPGGTFNVVLTTNFDDLVPDALFLYNNNLHPLVIGHESLAGFIRPTRTRPLVVKLHGDAHLTPLNIATETANLKAEVERQVQLLLNDRGLIILGYGGNDEGIRAMLASLPPEALPYGVSWVSGAEPGGKMRGWLEARRAAWVELFDFDELMLLLRDAFDLPHPDVKPFEALFRNYAETYQKLSERIRSIPEKAEEPALQSAVQRADEELPDEWSVAMEAIKLEKTDPEKAQALYQQSTERFHEFAPLLGNYALFLKKIRKDFDQAERYYQRALSADPDYANALVNYAIFLKNIRKDYDQAEQCYLRALAADSNDADYLSNYAFFLYSIRKDYDQAEQYYQRALVANPNYADALSFYANFLYSIRKDYNQAEHYYQRSLAADPKNVNNLGNYTGFLLGLGKQEQGLALLMRTISLLPANEYSGLAVEVWFYAFCHWPEEKRQSALQTLKKALLAGERSPDWDLSANITRARQDGHPDIAWIELLAEVITHGEDLHKLDGWKEWRKAGQP